MNWYLEVLKKYAVFGGRARRKEYWYFFLFHALIGIVLAIVDGVTGTLVPGAGIGLLGGLYSLAVFIPGCAVTVRRLHDTGKSGWWLLIFLVPLVGVIVFLVFMVKDSQPGENQYGPNPKVAEAEPPNKALQLTPHRSAQSVRGTVWRRAPGTPALPVSALLRSMSRGNEMAPAGVWRMMGAEFPNEIVPVLRRKR